MGRPGAFKSEKRKKELMRQKKQEAKRQKRLSGKDSGTRETQGETEAVEGVSSDFANAEVQQE